MAYRMNRLLPAHLFWSLTMALVLGLPARGNHDSGHEHHGSSSHVIRPVPAWSLESASRPGIVDSREFNHRSHVLVFHLGKGCLHCVEQLSELAACAPEFQQLGVQLLAISHEEIEQLRNQVADISKPLPFAMLADSEGFVFRKFRAFDPFNEQPLHATVFVDSRGWIRWQHIGRHPYMNFGELLTEIRRLRQDQDPPVKRPKILLDRSPRVVAYQLGRLNNERLLLVERNTDDKKYVPVFRAILARGGMSPLYREEALEALVTLNGSDEATELLDVVKQLDMESEQDQRTGQEIASLLLQQSTTRLGDQVDRFAEAVESDNPFLRSVGFAALLIAGESARAEALTTDENVADWLNAIPMLPSTESRNALRSRVVSLLDQEGSHRQLALQRLGDIPANQGDTFLRAATYIENEPWRATAVDTLLGVPVTERDPETSRQLVDYLVKFAEQTPAEQRTSDSFLDAMQLVDQLLVSIPSDRAKALRARLDQVSVRVVKINTVEDEMRYDLPYFAVEAGRPVQVILDNQDLIPHNLVITKTGKLKTVAILGGAAGPGKDYLPETRNDILFATRMLQSEQRERLTFDAPSDEGEYPYVCTFPQHWSRMYGVMVVVDDLDAWLKNPVKPKDPIGNTRSFVRKWQLDDFQELAAEPANGDREAGARIYREATCFQCHQLQGQGGQVGPQLDEVFAKHKHDRLAVMREIIDPSHRIDAQYSMHKILTIDGETITGIIQEENDDEILLLDNPESREFTKILQGDVEDKIKTSTSIMPRALLDNFTKEEILQLFSHLEQSQRK